MSGWVGAGALDGQAAVIDFCLRLADGGHLLVWTPSATLLHASDPSGMTVEVEDALYQRWLPRLARDAAYNANFSLVRKGGFQLTDPQISWRPLDIGARSQWCWRIRLMCSVAGTIASFSHLTRLAKQGWWTGRSPRG
ncbi:hypothetical protein ULG90_09635 [Halopseudomonas pachastrellae]|nr:hypothetical protein ULG90_09635 [Halopseudomonas pachastrellae]